MTRTFAELEISAQAFDEIAAALRAAGYEHAFVDGVIDMHGIGLTRSSAPRPSLLSTVIVDGPNAGRTLGECLVKGLAQ